MVELIPVTNEEIGCLAVEQHCVPVSPLNRHGTKGWRNAGGNGLQCDFEIGDLPDGDGDCLSYRREAVVNQFHLVVAGAQFQGVMATRFADRVVIHEDVCLFGVGMEDEIAVLSKTR